MSLIKNFPKFFKALKEVLAFFFGETIPEWVLLITAIGLGIGLFLLFLWGVPKVFGLIVKSWKENFKFLFQEQSEKERNPPGPRYCLEAMIPRH